MSSFEDIEDLGSGPFAAVLSACSQPNELRKVDGSYDGSLFGFDNGDWQFRVKFEEVFAEETLLQVVILEL